LENILESIKIFDLNILLNKQDELYLEKFLKLIAEKNTSVIKIDKIVEELSLKRRKIEKLIKAANIV
jgi:predicted AAA+ superfamily ATPase